MVELYSEALGRLGMVGPRAELMISVKEPVDRLARDVSVEVWRRHRELMPETAFVGLCEPVQHLDADGRARLALDVVHTAVRTLAGARDWDVRALDSCPDHVVAHGHVFTWAGAWKSSPDRRHQARVVCRIAGPDGFGRSRLEVRRRGQAVADAASPEAVASTTLHGLRRSAGTLRWSGSTEVGVTPFVGQGQHRQGLLVARSEETGGWSFDVRNDVTVRPPGGVGIHEDPDAPVPTVVGSLS